MGGCRMSKKFPGLPYPENEEKIIYKTPFPIEEQNVFTLTLRTDVLNAKMDKLLSSLGRIEDMLYYYMHDIKQPD
jgi:hypothetical protein